MSVITSVCMLGFGEVGSLLAVQLAERNPDLTLTAIDIAFTDSESPAAAYYAGQRRVSKTRCPPVDCTLVISAVTAEQSLAAATAMTELPAGCWFLDINSVAPATKRATAAVIEAIGGRYVEAALMSPIQPKGIHSPILLGGHWAQTFLPLTRQLGFENVTFCSAELGRAAATKMCRSVVIKGMEALLMESLLAAHHYGVETEVLASLSNLLPETDWTEKAHYMIFRSLAHGARRAEEMREVAKTVADADIEPLMSRACAERQQWAAAYKESQIAADLVTLLADIRNRLSTDSNSNARKSV